MGIIPVGNDLYGTTGAIREYHKEYSIVDQAKWSRKDDPYWKDLVKYNQNSVGENFVS